MNTNSDADDKPDYALWKQGMPWLYYSKEPSVSNVLSNLVDSTVSFDTEGISTPDVVDKLTYYLARYNIEGEFLGY